MDLSDFLLSAIIPCSIFVVSLTCTEFFMASVWIQLIISFSTLKSYTRNPVNLLLHTNPGSDYSVLKLFAGFAIAAFID